MAIEESSRFDSNSAEIASSLLDDELVLINLSTGVYYSMQSVGCVVWQLFDQGFSVAETVAEVAARYGVSADQAKADVHNLLEQMLAERIFVPASGARTRGNDQPEGGDTVRSYVSPVLHVYRDMGDLLALDAPMPDMEDVPWKGGSGD